MKTLYQYLSEMRSDQFRIVSDPVMINSRFAFIQGDTVFVSPAMHYLLADRDGNEAMAIARRINVIVMTPAIAKVREASMTPTAMNVSHHRVITQAEENLNRLMRDVQFEAARSGQPRQK